MAFRQTNPGVLTGSKGLELIVGGFRINGVLDPDAVWDAACNAVKAVTRVSPGLFEVELNLPYPRELVHGSASVHTAAAGASVNTANLVIDSYSSSTGKFRIVTVGQDGTPAATDPADNDIVTFAVYFQTRDVLVESHGA